MIRLRCACGCKSLLPLQSGPGARQLYLNRTHKERARKWRLRHSGISCSECPRSIFARGLCFAHYQAWRRGGGLTREYRQDPLGTASRGPQGPWRHVDERGVPLRLHLPPEGGD